MKKVAAWILGFLMVWNMESGLGMAADNQAFINNVYQESEEQAEILCTIPGETGSDGELQVLLGDQALPVHAVDRAGQGKLPKTVYCLVDVSGSMKERMDQAKEVLSAINDGLSEQDSLVIGKMGNQITDSAFLNTREDKKAEIDGLSYTGEDTDLYSGIIHGLKFLQQEPGVHSMRALVVISDGCDDQGDGSTWKEAYEMVSESDIPVYTAAIVLSEADYEQAKELGSFARNSAGGIHLPKSDDSGSKPISMTGQEMGQEIINRLGDAFRVQADLTGIRKTEKDTYRITVVYQNQAGRSYEDSFEIRARELKLREEAVKESGKETSEEATEAVLLDPKPSPEEDKNAWQLPVIAGSAVLAIALAVFGVTAARRKQEEKKRIEEERLCQEEERKRQKEQQRQEQEERERQEQARRQQEIEEQKAREEAYRSIPRLPVRLAAIGQQNKTCVVELVKGYEMTVGRNGNARIILDSLDTKLSGIHFVMFWDGKSLYVWDKQSKNGTSVNGVVINHLGRVAVRPGDSLRAGSYEYRLYWED